jgi:hypothetical protein
MNDILKRQAAEREKRKGDTAFDSLFPHINFRDTHESEKGAIFQGPAPLLIASGVIVLCAAIGVILL